VTGPLDAQACFAFPTIPGFAFVPRLYVAGPLGILRSMDSIGWNSRSRSSFAWAGSYLRTPRCDFAAVEHTRVRGTPPLQVVGRTDNAVLTPAPQTLPRTVPVRAGCFTPNRFTRLQAYPTTGVLPWRLPPPYTPRRGLRFSSPTTHFRGVTRSVSQRGRDTVWIR